MEYIRQWKVGDQVFGSKAEAQRYEAMQRLGAHNTTEQLISRADEVIALLKPFATPRTRKPKANGAHKAKGKTAETRATA